MTTGFEIAFWVCSFLVFYTYLGYGILLYFLVCLKRLFYSIPKYTLPAELPELTLLICAYNEEAIIHEKMQNCNALNYPKDKLHVVWVTDGSTDNTNTLLNKYPNVKVLFSPERKGKTAALNRSIPLINTELVVFTDANTILNTESLHEIVKCFQNPKVGCVSGEKRVFADSNNELAAQGEGIYWKYESFLKKLDSELYSTMGAAGELFAIRTRLFQPIDVNMLLDDFIMSMRIVQNGYKIAYCKNAFASEKGSANLKEEHKRKKRIAAGGIQSIWELKSLMNPFKYGIVSFQLVSHRFLRWSITPLALFALIPLNLVLLYCSNNWLYIIAWIFQCLFYLIAFLGVRIPSYFVFMNVNVYYGLLYLLNKKKGTGAWEKAKRL